MTTQDKEASADVVAYLVKDHDDYLQISWSGNICAFAVVRKSALLAEKERSRKLRKAIGTVCEGWTLPDDARKILESALWADPVAAYEGERE